jgi:hypothetical protein
MLILPFSTQKSHTIQWLESLNYNTVPPDAHLVSECLSYVARLPDATTNCFGRLVVPPTTRFFELLSTTWVTDEHLHAALYCLQPELDPNILVLPAWQHLHLHGLCYRLDSVTGLQLDPNRPYNPQLPQRAVR